MLFSVSRLAVMKDVSQMMQEDVRMKSEHAWMSTETVHVILTRRYSCS